MCYAAIAAWAKNCGDSNPRDSKLPNVNGALAFLARRECNCFLKPIDPIHASRSGNSHSRSEFCVGEFPRHSESHALKRIGCPMYIETPARFWATSLARSLKAGAWPRDNRVEIASRLGPISNEWHPNVRRVFCSELPRDLESRAKNCNAYLPPSP